jgi:quercetin dioxygenase-like cupin family protein
MVTEGKMVMDVNGAEYVLDTDDALYFDASYPHIYKNICDRKVKMVLLIYYV